MQPVINTKDAHLSLKHITTLNLAICTILYSVSSVPVLAKENKINQNVIDLGKTTVYAQKTKPDDYVKLENESANLLELTNQETPRAISTVTQAQMQDFEVYDVQDVIDTSNAIKVERLEPGRWWIRSRGFVVDQIAVDGFGSSFNLDNVTGDIDVAAYDSVEIIRGANGMMNNTGNASATVNLVRKMPTAKNEGKIKASVDNNGLYRLDTDMSGKLTDSGKLRGRLVTAYSDGDTFIDRNEKTNGVIYGVLEGDITDNITLAIGHEYNKQTGKGVMWGGLPLLNNFGQTVQYDDVATTSAPKWSTVDNTVNQTFVKVNIDTGIWETNLKAEKRQQTAEADWATAALPVLQQKAVTAPNEVKLDQSKYKTDNETSLFSAKTATSFQMFGKNHDIAMAAQYSKNNSEEFFNYVPTDNRVADITKWDGNSPQLALDYGPALANVERIEKSVAFSSRLNPIGNLYVLLGGRYVDYDYKGQAYGANWINDYNKFSPSAGITYDIEGINTTLYASYSDIFKHQTALDINAKPIKPTQGVSKEIGIKKSFNNDAALLAIAYFQNDMKNLAKVGGQRADGSSYSVASGEQKSNGFEVDLSGKLTETVTINAGYANTNFDKETKKEKTAYPKHMVKMSVNYQPSILPALRVGGNIKWQSEISVEDTTPVPGTTQLITVKASQPNYSTIDLFGEYAITNNVLFKLNVENVTNKKYYASLYGPEQYGVAFYNTIFGQPRTTTASIIMKY